ncbi:hypothetical protein PAPYR_10341 [Paratrimastix pyriformis]|uniref:Uncharacterized protein n=1 Tax=Paratrimastix pyriformis TaxID=342808 RepID=A0ABQ8UB35_9EUKA|nr:hypothetical protein PAPYR_10341 [Paratrimastix pyriformis]
MDHHEHGHRSRSPEHAPHHRHEDSRNRGFEAPSRSYGHSPHATRSEEHSHSHEELRLHEAPSRNEKEQRPSSHNERRHASPPRRPDDRPGERRRDSPPRVPIDRPDERRHDSPPRVPIDRPDERRRDSPPRRLDEPRREERRHHEEPRHLHTSSDEPSGKHDLRVQPRSREEASQQQQQQVSPSAQIAPPTAPKKRHHHRHRSSSPSSSSDSSPSSSSSSSESSSGEEEQHHKRHHHKRHDKKHRHQGAADLEKALEALIGGASAPAAPAAAPMALPPPPLATPPPEPTLEKKPFSRARGTADRPRLDTGENLRVGAQCPWSKRDPKVCTRKAKLWGIPVLKAILGLHLTFSPDFFEKLISLTRVEVNPPLHWVAGSYSLLAGAVEYEVPCLVQSVELLNRAPMDPFLARCVCTIIDIMATRECNPPNVIDIPRVLPILTFILQRHYQNEPVVMQACQTITHVTLRDTVEEATLDAPSMRILVEVIAQGVCPEATLQALWALTAKASHALLAGQVGALVLISQMLVLYVNNGPVVECLCKAISTLCVPDVNEQEAVRVGFVPLVVDLLRRYHSTATLAEWTCRALAAISCSQDSLRQILAERGIYTLLADVMQCHAQQPSVAEIACWLFANLTVHSVEPNSASCVIPSLIDLLRIHLSNSTLVTHAVRALINLISPVGPGGLCAHAAREAGLAPLMESAIKMYLADEALTAHLQRLEALMVTDEPPLPSTATHAPHTTASPPGPPSSSEMLPLVKPPTGQALPTPAIEELIRATDREMGLIKEELAKRSWGHPAPPQELVAQAKQAHKREMMERRAAAPAPPCCCCCCLM